MSEENTTAPVTDTKSDTRRARKTQIGLVVSDKMDRTIVVEVERRIAHPKFKKIIRKTTKYYAHDEKEEASIGDKVLIEETRPLSKLKRWRLIEIQKH